ncbi:ECF transporter S component [Atopobiaceae bacterium 24-176]
MSYSVSSLVVDRPLPCVSVRVAATAAAVALAVAVPQLFHAVGAFVGAGTGLGEVWLPMHLPIMLVGLLAGPAAGLVAGLLGPVASFALSGMPGAAMLPFMMVELAAYGVAAGFVRRLSLPAVPCVLLVQLVGRAARALALAAAATGLGAGVPAVSTVVAAVVVGLPGLCLQWVLAPAAFAWVRSVAGQDAPVSGGADA